MANLVGRILGPYRLLEQIGHGGMASVYKAYDPKQDREVALKVMSPSLADDPRFTKRFVREAKVVLQLKHPNIVPVWDFGAADGYFYLVMPYLKVGTLSDRLQRGPLGLQESAHLVSQICSALDLAHRQGVVHRDIKPSNILMDENGNALLTDFGLAQIQDATLSLTGSALLGTPAYVSPEQARGDPVDPRSDQYSIGIILFQLATGQLPFDAETPMAIVLKHVQEPLPLPRSINPRVPESVQRIILKATAKDPADRFPTVADLNSVFQAALAHALDPRVPAPQVVVPPSAQVTSPLRTALPEKRRPRTPVWVGALVALLFLVPAIALAAPGIVEIIRPDPSAPAILFVTPTGLAATIDALSTDLARPSSGAGMSGDQVATAVAGTLVAQGALPASGQGFAFQIGQQMGTPTDNGPFYVGTSSPTRTPTTGGGGPGASATPTRTATPTPTVLGAPTEPATNTPTRTATIAATDTPVAIATRTPTPVQPTNTPVPPSDPTIDPSKCKPPGHPVFGCTPTPGP